MSRRIATGIDIGTHQIRVVIGERISTKGRVARRIIGTGSSESHGIQQGYVMHAADTIKSLQRAVVDAEKTAGVNVRKALVSVGGVSLEGALQNGSSVISRADSEITNVDVEKAVEDAERSFLEAGGRNRKIVHSIPVEFKIDGKTVLGRPAGMKGMKLESRVLIVSALEQHINDLINVIEEAGIEVEDITASPLAAGVVNLTKTQRVAGVVLVNIGAETVSAVIYEGNTPVSLKMFPIGSSKVTHDIALGLRIPLEEAEALKVGEHETPDVYPKKKLDEIMNARLVDIFELVEGHLKKIKKSGLLPAGVVLTGGGSGLASIDDLARAALKLPASFAELNTNHDSKMTVSDASWSVAYGLAMIGLTMPNEDIGGLRLARQTTDSVARWIKQFLP